MIYTKKDYEMDLENLTSKNKKAKLNTLYNELQEIPTTVRMINPPEPVRNRIKNNRVKADEIITQIKALTKKESKPYNSEYERD